MNLGVAAFWLFLAAIIVAGTWRKKHTEAMRHETVRLLIEKNRNIDDAQLAELLNPTPPPCPEWLVPKQRQGDGYRVLRVFGSIVMFLALGLVIAAIWRALMLGVGDRSVLDFGTGVPFTAMLGAGLFVASRFVTKPPSDQGHDK